MPPSVYYTRNYYKRLTKSFGAFRRMIDDIIDVNMLCIAQTLNDEPALRGMFSQTATQLTCDFMRQIGYELRDG